MPQFVNYLEVRARNFTIKDLFDAMYCYSLRRNFNFEFACFKTQNFVAAADYSMQSQLDFGFAKISC